MEAEKPVKKGREITVLLDGEGKHGDGMCKINNFAIFVPRSIIGKKYKIRITEVYSTFAFGKILMEIKEE